VPVLCLTTPDDIIIMRDKVRQPTARQLRPGQLRPGQIKYKEYNR